MVRILAIRRVPPVEDPFLCGSQQWVGRQPIAFFVLIDLPVGGHQIPEIAAGPDGPGKAVIDVEVGGAQPLAAPDAVETSCGEQLLGALPGNPHVPRRVRPCHCRGQPGFVKCSSLFRSVTLRHAYPLGDDGGLDPCAEASNGRPQVRRHAHRSKAGKIGCVQPYAARHPRSRDRAMHREDGTCPVGIGHVADGHLDDGPHRILDRLVKRRAGVPGERHAHPQIVM